MGLGVGIVGLPNVGKSTTFNALTKAQNAESANYPFCTIEPNKAVVPVPDKRLAQLANIINPQKIQHSTIDFVDIAGLVKGASKGEGLGNKFLGNIKETEVILHIVRCFDDDNITHVEDSVHPLRDIEIIEGELLMADIQALENRIDKFKKQLKGNDKTIKAEFEMSERLFAHINDELEPVCTFAEKDDEIFQKIDKELRFLTNKEIIYGANVNEDDLAEDNNYVKEVKEYASERGREVVKLCAKVEEEMVTFSDEEKNEMLSDLGVDESGLEQIIRKAFHSLGLINYFTAGVKEVRSWTIVKGDTAPQAAGVIHTDFEKGFIRAETIAFEEFIKNNGLAGSKEAGVVRLEGKEYIVKDGDIMNFRFNV